MAIYRNRTQQFTVIAQGIMRDERLSLKDTGLLVRMLSLPDNWEFSENGLIQIFKQDGQSSIRTGLKRLEEFGYLVRKRTRDNAGRMTGTEWVIYDSPYLENQSVEELNLENQPQSNTNQSTTKEISTKGNKERKEQTKKTNFDAIVADYTENEELRSTLFEFIKMRQRIRKPLTDYALRLLLKKLDKLGQTDALKVELLNQSIMNGWQDVYALKKSDTQAEKQPKYKNIGTML